MLLEKAKAARGLLIARALSKDKDVDLRLILGVMGDAVNHEKIQALEEEMEDMASDEEKRADFDVELEEQRKQRMQSGMSEEMQALEETLEKDKAHQDSRAKPAIPARRGQCAGSLRERAGRHCPTGSKEGGQCLQWPASQRQEALQRAPRGA